MPIILKKCGLEGKWLNQYCGKTSIPFIVDSTLAASACAQTARGFAYANTEDIQGLTINLSLFWMKGWDHWQPG